MLLFAFIWSHICFFDCSCVVRPVSLHRSFALLRSRSLFLSVHYNNLTIHKHLLLFVRFNSNSNSIQAIAHISKLSIDFPLESQTINILRFTKCSIVHVHYERDSFSCILCWNVFENINTRTQSSMLKIWVDLIEEEKHRISMVLFGIFRLCGRREDWRTYSFDKKNIF